MLEKYEHKSVEARWKEYWDKNKTYSWNPNVPRDKTFVVDTPPPTVSGSLHVGHVFSYTHTDLIVRYQRMLGKNIMYPMGWDDNGLPTERRVQNKFRVSCNARLPYVSGWSPRSAASDKDPVEEISRQNFIELSSQLTKTDEEAFELLWRQLGLSVDWTEMYATIDDNCRRISQWSFLDLWSKGFVYSSESPTMWDVDFQTALAQADLEDRTIAGAYHDVRFGVDGDLPITISTTRPELIPACIGVVAHPSDERYQRYFGKTALTPLFRIPLPIRPSEHAQPDKGTGIMMVSTFGDSADVEWWKQSGEPIRQIIGRDGRLQPIDFRSEPFLSRDPHSAASAYAFLQGKTAKQARAAIADLLSKEGSAADGAGVALVGAPRPIEHPVKYYEKGERPIEFVTTRQWFIRILEHKKALLAQGSKIHWHPEFMRSRYDNWVEGLNADWCISRQRYFGVPFPVWYRLRADKTVDYEAPIFATQEMLPIDPLSQPPPGFRESQRGVPGGFVGDPDVMDTWATSSLTPQLVSLKTGDAERHAKLYPADIRPQSHEIIRTWAFYTIAKAWMHSNDIPWKNVVISGWILDPDRKKMSKSRGNVVTPQHLLEQYSSDAVRYWAARARLGVDTAFDEKVFKNGQKLSLKIFNVSRFIVGHVQTCQQQGQVFDVRAITEELDRAAIESLRDVVREATENFEAFEYAGALQVAESAFWSFCDHYVELAKTRAYAEDLGAARLSAVATLDWALKTFLRLFAPAMPYVTEEVWSWHYAGQTQHASIHRSPWPHVSEVSAVQTPNHAQALALATEVLTKVRAEKSTAQRTLRWPVEQVSVRAPAASIRALRGVLGDIERAGRVAAGQIVLSESASSEAQLEIEVRLGTESDGMENPSGA